MQPIQNPSIAKPCSPPNPSSRWDKDLEKDFDWTYKRMGKSPKPISIDVKDLKRLSDKDKDGFVDLPGFYNAFNIKVFTEVHRRWDAPSSFNYNLVENEYFNSHSQDYVSALKDYKALHPDDRCVYYNFTSYYILKKKLEDKRPDVTKEMVDAALHANSGNPLASRTMVVT